MFQKLSVFRMYLSLIILGCSVLMSCGEKEINNPGTGSSSITVNDSFYGVTEKTIFVGKTVEWNWQGNIGHSVTGGISPNPNGSFDSGVLSMGTFSHKFDTEGTFKYYCRVHGAAMTGAINVIAQSDGEEGEESGGAGSY